MPPFWTIDSRVVEAFNRFAASSPLIDWIVLHIESTILLKGGFVVVLYWWAWLKQDAAGVKKRATLLTGLFVSIFAVFIARALAISLPFRARPLYNPALHIQLLPGMNPGTLFDWSSFPSDHAVIFFCLAACLWYVSKPLGAIAFCHAIFVVCLPRVYLGIHYPTDLICGALLGMAISTLALNNWIRKTVGHRCVHWSQEHPQAFGVAAFLLSFELTELFDTFRHALVSVAGLFHAAVLQALR